MADTTAWQRLAPELARLEAYYLSTRAAHASSDVPEETLSGINGLFTTASNLLIRLRANGDLGKAVVDGVPGAVERWVHNANIAGEALNSVQQILDEEDLWHRAWDEIVVPTVEETKETLEDLGSGGLSVLRTIAFIFGAYVVLQILKVVR